VDAELLKYGLAGIGLLAEAWVIRELWKEIQKLRADNVTLYGVISASQEARRIDAVETAEKTTQLSNNVIEAVKLLGDKIDEPTSPRRRTR
jgi:hypothetical protein